MRSILSVVAFVLAAALTAHAQDHGPFHPASVDVYFSPKGGATEACVAAITSDSLCPMAHGTVAAMPLFQSQPKLPALALTKDRDRVVAYALTAAAVRRLKENGVRNGRKFPAAILASLIRTGDAHSPRPADHAGQITLFADDDTADQLPRCDATGTTTDLHLVVYGEGLGTVAKLLGIEPRFVLQKVTKLSIPAWALSGGLLDQLETTGKLPFDSPATAALRQWFRRNYDAAWTKLAASNARQEDLDLGPAAGELPLSGLKAKG